MRRLGCIHQYGFGGQIKDHEKARELHTLNSNHTGSLNSLNLLTSDNDEKEKYLLLSIKLKSLESPFAKFSKFAHRAEWNLGNNYYNRYNRQKREESIKEKEKTKLESDPKTKTEKSNNNKRRTIEDILEIFHKTINGCKIEKCNICFDSYHYIGRIVFKFALKSTIKNEKKDENFLKLTKHYYLLAWEKIDYFNTTYKDFEESVLELKNDIDELDEMINKLK